MNIWRFAVGLLAGILAVLLISVFGATSAGTRDYDPSIMASWVQAVGSIAAIIGAFLILKRQQSVEADIRRRDEKRRYAARFRQVFLLAGDAAEAFDHLAVLLSAQKFDDPDSEPLGRLKTIARIEHVAGRIDGIAHAVAGVIRAGEVELDHVNLLWKLNRNLQSLGQMLAGISDPFDELDAVSMEEFDTLVEDVKVIRFAAAHISAELEGTAETEG